MSLLRTLRFRWVCWSMLQNDVAGLWRSDCFDDDAALTVSAVSRGLCDRELFTGSVMV